MKPLGLVVGVALLLTTAGSVPGSAGGPLNQKLSSDKQAVHVLNRLGYGPGRGGVEAVRRMASRSGFVSSCARAASAESRARIQTEGDPHPADREPGDFRGV